MNRTALMLGAALLLAAAARAEDPKAQASAFAKMSEVCHFDAGQLAKVKAIEETRDQAIKEWQEKSEAKIKETQAKILDLSAKQDHKGLNEPLKAMQDLYKPYVDALQKAHVDVMALLTDEQKVRWRDYQLEEFLKSNYARAHLTDEQVKTIKALYADLFKEDPVGALGKLTRKVNFDILTEDQRQANGFFLPRMEDVAIARIQDQKVILKWGDSERTLTIPPNTPITIDGKEAKASDLKPDMKLTVIFKAPPPEDGGARPDVTNVTATKVTATSK